MTVGLTTLTLTIMALGIKPLSQTTVSIITLAKT
jgi:hypothetical protein